MQRAAADTNTKRTNDEEEIGPHVVIVKESETLRGSVPRSKDKIANGSRFNIPVPVLQLVFLSFNIAIFIMQMGMIHTSSFLTSYLHKNTNTNTNDAERNRIDLHSTNTNTNKQLGELKIKEWKEKVPKIISNMPKAQLSPDEKRPFVYFHPRKSGGSSLRSIMHEMTKERGIKGNKKWFPCIGARDCTPFSLPNPVEDYVVYGGHLNFMHMTNIMREVKDRKILLDQKESLILENGETITYHTVDDSHALFDCVTTIRPTVERVVSCWNFRFSSSKKSPSSGFSLPRSNELAPQDFTALLPNAYDAHGNGCNNEYARIFGSSVDETHVNTLSPRKPDFLQELDKIASRISKCVILRVDRCEDSNTIIEHFIPWMRGADVCSKHQKNFGKSSDEVSKEARAVILEQNYIDELIFNLGEELFEKQWKKLHELLNSQKHLIRNLPMSYIQSSK